MSFLKLYIFSNFDRNDLLRSLNFYNNSRGLCLNWDIINNIFDLNRPVLFLNYDSNILKKINYISENNSNSFEADIISFLIKTLMHTGYNINEIGILTPFVNQEILLKQKLDEFQIKDNILTIDKSQGSEKELIIISFCRITPERNILLDSIERMNVAFTRAKSKLICIGDYEILKNSKNLDLFLQSIIKNNWIINLTIYDIPI